MPGLSSANATREAEIRGFIAEAFPLGGDAADIRADESLLEAGVVDSTGVLELIGFLETRYGLSVPDDDLLPENFDSIANILVYLERRLGP